MKRLNFMQKYANDAFPARVTHFRRIMSRFILSEFNFVLFWRMPMNE